MWKGKIDTAFCRKTKFMKDAAAATSSGKKFFSDGVLCILAYATSERAHRFYFRHAENKRRYPFAKLDDLATLKQGGERTLKDIRAEAEKLAHGDEPEAKVGVSNLFDCLNKFCERAELSPDSEADWTRTIRVFGDQWLDEPVTKIDEKQVADLFKLIKAGEFEHPHWIDTSKMSKEEKQARIDELQAAGFDGLPKKQFCGTPKQADKFARYLLTVLVRTDDTGKHFTLDKNPINTPKKNIINGAAKSVARPAVCIEPDELHHLMKFSRKQCKNQQSGLFNPLRWQKFLAAKLAVFTGYRVGDLWNLHEGNLTDEPGVILKQIDEQMKSGNKSEENQAPHALPVTRQIDDLIAEARALRDVDRETLAKRFKWTKKELEALKKVAPVESDLIFPSLTGKNIGQKYGQKSDIMRDAFELLKGPKKDGEHTGAQFKKRARKQGRKRLPGTSFPKPHDLRATFSTLAVRAGYDFAVVSEFTNHTIPQSIMVAHYAASAMTDEQLAEAMQKINDFIEKTATDYRP